MRYLVFEGNTWADYEEFRQKDKNLHKNLCKIIKELLRDDPAKGIGKPEPLKHNLSGLWSRRLSQKDRLIYKFDDSVCLYICDWWSLRLAPNYYQHYNDSTPTYKCQEIYQHIYESYSLLRLLSSTENFLKWALRAHFKKFSGF